MSEKAPMQSTPFVSSTGETRNPIYEGQFDGETPEQAEARRHWAKVAMEMARNAAAAVQPGATVKDFLTVGGVDERAAFEAAYSGEYGTPLSVLRLLREGDAYIEKPQHSDRLNSSWWMWKQARAALSAPSQGGPAAVMSANDWRYIRLCSALYQACGAYDMPGRVLDALSAAANSQPFIHLVDGLLPCVPAHSDVSVPRELLERICPVTADDGWQTWNTATVYEAAKELRALLNGGRS